MNFNALTVNQDLKEANERVEDVINTLVRGYDKIMGLAGLGGRKADYDDESYEFLGGPNEELRKKHYDKSLRLLWKAEKHASWSTFKDCTKEEQMLNKMAEDNLNDFEQREYDRIKTAEFKQFLNEQYTQEQKEAIVTILSIIGHGEAYAWLVSNEVLRDVKSTGAKAALTMQVLEEAKHFVVLRELIRAFDVEIPRMPAYEYIILESALKADGLEKFFGMNVLVEGIALSIFGAMCKYPGLEVLKMFHLDESRHTALPTNYFKTQPMTWWDKHNPTAMTKRFMMILPAIPMVMKFEPYFAVLGIDVFDFAGSLVRKVIHLSYRVGFIMPLPQETLKQFINLVFNTYCSMTREQHEFANFLDSETTVGEEELEVEREVFQLNQAAS